MEEGLEGVLVFDEFEEGDPRRGPHTLTVQNDAAVHAGIRSRWHQRVRSIDWMAVRLAVGRGVPQEEAARMFGVSRTHIGELKRKGKWLTRMTERDRRELSVLVWLAGVKRIARDDHESREALKKASEWRKHKKTTLVWREKDRQGEPHTYTINDEIPDDAYFSEADPQRDERQSVLDRLESRLEELKAEYDEEDEADDEEEFETESAGRGDPLGDPSDRVDTLPGGMEESGGCEDGVEGVGSPEPASS